MELTVLRAVSMLTAMSVSGATSPPPAKVIPYSETLYGTVRSDPYHWMESGGADLSDYLDRQTTYTQSVLGANPGRTRVLQALRDADAEAASATTTSGAVRVGSRVLFLQSLPGSSNPSLLARDDEKTILSVIVNATSLPEDRVITWFEPSPTGTKIAYGVSASSESTVIHVCDADGSHDTVQAIDANVVQDATWRDERAFYYSTIREGEKDRTETSHLHVIGAPKGDDTLIGGFGANGPLGSATDRDLSLSYTVLGSDAVIAMPQHDVTPHASVFVAPFSNSSRADASWRQMFGESDEVVQVAIAGRYLFALSDRGEARRTIVVRDRSNGKNVRTIVPDDDGFRTSVFANKTGLYVAKRVGAEMRLERYDLEGRRLGDVSLPTANVLAMRGDAAKSTFMVQTVTYEDPGHWYEISGSRATVRDVGISPRPPALYAGIRYQDSVVASADGTKVPYTVVYNDGTPKDGNRPTLVFGYGAYGYDPLEPPTPSFAAALLKLGVVVVLVHPRGGGEYGEPWHLAGKGPTKQHTIDDFVAGAQAAIDDGWTSHAKLAGFGSSAGGIAIGGAITQHPGLFAVAISKVGFSDMVDLENMPNGPANVPEFGSVKTASGFHDLLAMSAYDHVAPAPYPATILTTGLSDRRNAPWQVAKMTARLAASTTSGKPILLRADSQGHGVIRDVSAQENEDADVYTFMLWQLGERGFGSLEARPARRVGSSNRDAR